MLLLGLQERDMEEEQMLLLIRWMDSGFVCRYSEIQINAMVDVHEDQLRKFLLS